MYKLTLVTEIQGATFVDVFTKYPCRHLHHRWTVDGKGPKRARRLKKGSIHYQRFEEYVKRYGNN